MIRYIGLLLPAVLLPAALLSAAEGESIAFGRVEGEIRAATVQLEKKFLPFPLELTGISGRVHLDPDGFHINDFHAGVLGGELSGNLFVDFSRGGSPDNLKDAYITLKVDLKSLNLEGLTYPVSGILDGHFEAVVHSFRLQSVKASVNLRRFRFGELDMRSFRANMVYTDADRKLRFDDIDAEAYNGALIGAVVMVFPGDFSYAEYSAELWAEDIELDEFRQIPGLNLGLRGNLSGRLEIIGRTDREPRRITGRVTVTPLVIRQIVNFQVDEFSSEIVFDRDSRSIELRAMDAGVYNGRIRGQMKAALGTNALGETFLEQLTAALEVKGVAVRNLFRLIKVDIHDGVADGLVHLRYTDEGKRIILHGAVKINDFAYADLVRAETVAGGFAWDSKLGIVEFQPLEARLFGGRFKGSGVLILKNESADPKPVLLITNPVSGSNAAGRVTVRGLAWDNRGLKSVDFRTGGGNWTAADGLGDWRFAVDMPTFSGNDTDVEVRAVSGAGAARQETLKHLSVVLGKWSVEDQPRAAGSHPLHAMPDTELLFSTMSRNSVHFRLNGLCSDIELAQLNSAYGDPARDVGGQARGLVSFRVDSSGLASLLADAHVKDFHYKNWRVDSLDAAVNYDLASARLEVRASDMKLYGGSGKFSAVFDLNRKGHVLAVRDGAVRLKDVSLTRMSHQQDWQTRVEGKLTLNLRRLAGNLKNKVTLRGIGTFSTRSGTLYKLPILGFLIYWFNTSELRYADGEFQLYGDEIRFSRVTITSRDRKTILFMDTDAGPPGAFDFDGDIRQTFFLNWARPKQWWEAIPGVGWVIRGRDITSRLGRQSITGSFKNPNLGNWAFSLKYMLGRKFNPLWKRYEKKRRAEEQEVRQWERISYKLLLIDDNASGYNRFTEPLPIRTKRLHKAAVTAGNDAPITADSGGRR